MKAERSCRDCGVALRSAARSKLCGSCRKISDAAYRKAHRKANPETYRLRQVEWRRANPEKVSAQNRRRYKADPERERARRQRYRYRMTADQKALCRERYREWIAANKYRVKSYNLRRTLARLGSGLTEYEAILASQNGRCGICGNGPGGTRLHVDHDHQTLCIRGLLCGRCNTGIGLLRDEPAILWNAIKYLTRVKKGQTNVA